MDTIEPTPPEKKPSRKSTDTPKPGKKRTARKPSNNSPLGNTTCRPRVRSRVLP